MFDLAVSAINVSRTFLLRPGSEGLGWQEVQIYVGRGAVCVCVWRREEREERIGCGCRKGRCEDKGFLVFASIHSTFRC